MLFYNMSGNEKGKAKKTLRFDILRKIKRITRRNRKTGTENNSDSDDNDEYEELLPLPPSPPRQQVIPPMVPVPSKELLEIQEENRLKREQMKKTYTPRIIIFDPENVSKGVYSEIISRDFVQYLAQNDINIRKETPINILEHYLIIMYEDPRLNKEVVGCDFYRKDGEGNPIFFDKDKTLQTYSELIEDWSSDKMSKNYFYVNIYLRDMPSSMGGFKKRKRTMRKKNIRSSKMRKRR